MNCLIMMYFLYIVYICKVPPDLYQFNVLLWTETKSVLVTEGGSLGN